MPAPLQLRSLAACMFALVIACTGGQGGDPGAAPDAQVTGGSGGSGGGGGGGGTGGEPIGAGLAHADLDTEVLRVQLGATLHGSEVGSSRALRAQPTGLFVRATTGFWEVERDAEPRRFESSSLNYDLITVDLDGDEDSDVVTQEPVIADEGANLSPDAIHFVLKLWERVGQELIARTELPSSHDTLADRHTVGDVDGDGDSDFVTFDRGRVIVHRNEGALAFTRLEASARVEDHTDDWHTAGLVLADRNGDGAQDLLVLAQSYPSPSSSDAMVFLGDGEAAFLPPTIARVMQTEQSAGRHSAQLGDVTGDGLADIVLEPRQHPGDHFLAASVDATTVSEARSLGHVGLLLQLVDFNGDGTLDIAGRSYEQLFVDVSLGAGAFETRWFEIAVGEIADLIVTPPSGSIAARVDLLYRFRAPHPCRAECKSCVFDACVECVTHGDCEHGRCSHGVCMVDEDEDGGVP